MKLLKGPYPNYLMRQFQCKYFYQSHWNISKKVALLPAIPLRLVCVSRACPALYPPRHDWMKGFPTPNHDKASSDTKWEQGRKANQIQLKEMVCFPHF